jgi:hypothetical protein
MNNNIMILFVFCFIFFFSQSQTDTKHCMKECCSTVLTRSGSLLKKIHKRRFVKHNNATTTALQEAHQRDR